MACMCAVFSLPMFPDLVSLLHFVFLLFFTFAFVILLYLFLTVAPVSLLTGVGVRQHHGSVPWGLPPSLCVTPTAPWYRCPIILVVNSSRAGLCPVWIPGTWWCLWPREGAQ